MSIVFQDACKMMLKVVVPFGVGWRTRRGRLNVSIGAGMVINDGGCLLTAGQRNPWA